MNKHSYKILKMQNGLQVILHTMPQMHAVSVYVGVGAGSRYESRETTGLAHFLEHMLFEGTEKLPTSKEIAEYIENIGGARPARADKEDGVYFFQGTPRNFRRGVKYFSSNPFPSFLI